LELGLLRLLRLAGQNGRHGDDFDLCTCQQQRKKQWADGPLFFVHLRAELFVNMIVIQERDTSHSEGVAGNSELTYEAFVPGFI